MALPSLFKDEPITPTLNSRNAPSRGPFASYSGRTKTVMQGDIQGAFRQLGSVLRQNNVMREFRQQKFYEKPSDKRGRLSRERHRKRFLLGVRRLVGLVKEQRKFQ
ncbi:hypothetical protein BCR37DRAFT_394373 [Protomyces lactucae-debilis]|uniref:Uncharacterized protein n=1 Tax=Protomyces lactucae-debilis TaxID=2754530 RepID=A0A1Y2F542_PROLT|nr:uncharacterized protein BCR37DRAFT_394373 [Protomyces lactucae-debilis]ORY79030.1 hypothetical protein BCR37DRAFT_394373 [Protomyces lactucae-debilis]